MSDTPLESARAAVRARAWSDAFELLTRADRESPLGTDDLEALSTAAGLLHRIEDSVRAGARAYNALLAADPARAARRAFWLGLHLMNIGDHAQGGGWLGRAANALERVDGEAAEHGLLLIPAGLQALDAGRFEDAREAFTRAREIGERFADADVTTLGYLGLGQTLISMGRAPEGLGLLDQAMVAVTADETEPALTGIVYCAVILACRDAFDVRRAREWTAALDSWCRAQPGLVPFRGQCMVHRSELLQMRGAWREAIEEAGRAHARLADPPGQPAIGMAFYQLAELHRVTGELAEAERAYRDANKHGHPPQPGVSLLMLARGDSAAALAALTTALDEGRDAGTRCRLLWAMIEVALACGDVERANTACEELGTIAGTLDATLLDAMWSYGRGAVLEAMDDPRGALEALREALVLWQGLDMPYEAARTRIAIARACLALGDAMTADLETDAARETLTDLQARPMLEQLDARPAERPGGITAREAEILRLVATGATNKAIAAELVISEKTVARHLSNIFTKLGLSTRAEATAYAFKHDLA